MYKISFSLSLTLRHTHIYGSINDLISTASGHQWLDFKKLLRYVVLLLLQGDRETFENYYRKQRKKQARLVLQPQGNMVSSSTHWNINSVYNIS